MDATNPVPDHIKEKSKELAWVSDSTVNWNIQRQFAAYCDLTPIFIPFHSTNINLCDIADSVGFASISWLNSYLRPNYQDGMIESFVTLVDIYRNKRQTMKAGKYFKKIWPFLTDAQVESCVAFCKAANSPLEFELIDCGKPESFESVYKTSHVLKQSPSFDGGGDFDIKRLDSSCMRGECFSGWAKHPAYVYGYGDLRILYAKEKTTGHIGARCIIFPARESASAIYTANDTATKLIVDYLESNGYDSRGIDGARVLKIAKKGDYYLMPYVDDCDNAEDCGDYFLLGSGNLRCKSADGTMYLEELFYCDDCGDSFPEYESTEVNGSCVCMYCRGSNYVYSELMDEYLSSDDADSNGDGEIATSRYFETHGYVIDHDGVWQIESECVEYQGEYYHESSHYVTCFEGINYHEDSDELIAAIEAKEKDDAAYQVKVSIQLDWKLDRAEYNPTPYLALITTKERTLRDNYQLNANGEPERLPEFDFAC